MKKYQITYDTVGGNGKVITDKYEVSKVRATLENSGCFNIAVSEIYEDDPCDRCNRNLCHGCPHAE